MCGFVGVVRSPGRGVRRDELEPLAGVLARRGPDGTGVFVDGEIGLLASRLAIQGGHESDQPLVSPEGRFVLAYNGELFASHRRALRGLLRAEGAGEVRATSDSALLVAWLAHRLSERRAGDSIDGAALHPLRGGMYAFALVDLRAREVLLHGDADAIKPLYAMGCPDRGETWFSSTMLPLHLVAGGSRTIDPAALAWRLLSPSGRGALARGPYPIEDVAGATALLAPTRAGRVTLVTPSAAPAAAGAAAAEPDSRAPDLDALRVVVEDAAREAGETAGPVTLFLSGGLDSAAVAAWCGRADALALTGRFAPVGGPFDESDLASEVAVSRAMRHEVVDLSDRDLLLDLPDVLDALEEPMGGPGSLAMHRLAHRARLHGRVALSGTGGDERFAGYARIALALGRAGPFTEGYEPLRAQLTAAGPDPRRRWLAAVDRTEDLLPYFDPAFRRALPIEETRGRLYDALFGVESPAHDFPPARAIVAAEIATSLRMLLAVEDRVGMSLALECRPVACLGQVPAAAARLPEGWLVGPDGEGKRALRAALAGRVPESVRLSRRKRGFPTPFHRAATGAGKDVASALLADARFRGRGWWDVDACTRLLGERRADHDRALFSILSLEVWARRFLDGEALADAQAASA